MTEEAGLVRRERPPGNRRVVQVFITPEGATHCRRSRAVRRRGIQQHFAQHLDKRDLAALTRALEKVPEHMRFLRPGCIGC